MSSVELEGFETFSKFSSFKQILSRAQSPVDPQVLDAPAFGQAFAETASLLDFHEQVAGIAAPAVIRTPPLVDVAGHGPVDNKGLSPGPDRSGG